MTLSHLSTLTDRNCTSWGEDLNMCVTVEQLCGTTLENQYNIVYQLYFNFKKAKTKVPGIVIISHK